jgi:signal transduction histidine kinase
MTRVDPPDLGSRPRRGSVRLRATLGAVVVVAVALLACSLLLVATLRHTLTDGVIDDAHNRVEDVGRQIADGPLPLDLPVSDDDEEVVQVYDAGGTILASSPNARGMGPLVRPGHPEDQPIANPVGEDPMVVVTAIRDTAAGPRTILDARALGRVNDTTDAVTEELAIGLPVMMLVVALTSRLVVGWALFPVEAMRREVDEISSAELHRRVRYAPGDDEFARLSRTMNRMLDRLEEAQRRQRRLVSDASHELRSPVAGVRQHAEVALQHPDRTDGHRFAETVLAQSIRLQRLIDDLLLLARADENALLRGGAPVDLDDLVFAEANRLRSASALRVHTAEVSAGRVDGDLGGLTRVLFNLGENAARHARKEVWFALGYRGDRVVLTVDDDGDGIPEQDRQRVLERFVRLDEGRARDAGGSGLGLAIVRELVVAHGGEIGIDDSPHGGARVTLAFPASTDPGDEPVPRAATNGPISADTRPA